MIGPILRRAEAGRLPSRREVLLMLNAKDNQYQALLDSAHRLCQKHKGEETELRCLVTVGEGSNLEAVVGEAVSAWRLGCAAVVIQQEERAPGVEQVFQVIREIRQQTAMQVALCLGECSYDAYAAWRQAGADEYILPHECCNPRLYEALHPGHSPAERLTRYLWLKGLGYRVTGGLRIGLEGQSPENLADDLEILRNAGVSGVVLRPVNGTPEVLRMMAITRVCLPHADIWLATDDVALQAQALACGASLIVTSLPGEKASLDSIPFAMAQAL